eukprot:m.35676 g.35676  ORF g.35676 m.35676 type:complete len:607 (+) comp10943_c1_seq1:97-1917(+)
MSVVQLVRKKPSSKKSDHWSLPEVVRNAKCLSFEGLLRIPTDDGGFQRLQQTENEEGLFLDACRDPLMVLFVSHRWEDPKHPDPHGRQLRALQQLVRDIVMVCEAASTDTAAARLGRCPTLQRDGTLQAATLAGYILKALATEQDKACGSDTKEGETAHNGGAATTAPAQPPVAETSTADTPTAETPVAAADTPIAEAQTPTTQAHTTQTESPTTAVEPPAPAAQTPTTQAQTSTTQAQPSTTLAREVLRRCGLWYDFASLYQVPRTPAEDAVFSAALVALPTLLASCTAVVSLREPGDDYEERGWCMVEMECSSRNSRSFNALRSPLVLRLNSQGTALPADYFGIESMGFADNQQPCQKPNCASCHPQGAGGGRKSAATATATATATAHQHQQPPRQSRFFLKPEAARRIYHQTVSPLVQALARWEDAEQASAADVPGVLFADLVGAHISCSLPPTECLLHMATPGARRLASYTYETLTDVVDDTAGTTSFSLRSLLQDTMQQAGLWCTDDDDTAFVALTMLCRCGVGGFLAMTSFFDCARKKLAANPNSHLTMHRDTEEGDRTRFRFEEDNAPVAPETPSSQPGQATEKPRFWHIKADRVWSAN